MSTSASIIELYKQFPNRRHQFEILQELLGAPCDMPPPSIFIYGMSGSGKSLAVSSLLKFAKVPHVIVNCIECYGPRLLFEMILNGLMQIIPNQENGYNNYSNCENANDFISNLKNAIKESGNDSETVYIVLKKADRLCSLNSYILPFFLRLQEFVQLNVCVVLLSELIWEKFRTPSGFLEPVSVHFPQHTKDELCEILLMERPEEYSLQFYTNYIQIILSTFYLVSRDIVELRYVARTNFRKYVEPVVSGFVEESDSQSLWRSIKPHLRMCLHTTNLSGSPKKRPSSIVATEFGLTSCQYNVELPCTSKYLLIAAYLASYNPAKTDSRFFAKNRGKTKKPMTASKRKQKLKVSNHLLGPKPFPIGRLLAIFYSVVEDKVSRDNIYSQISTLVSLNLLSIVGRQEVLSSPKYKCLASLDFVTSIGRSLNMDVKRYLYDFL